MFDIMDCSDDLECVHCGYIFDDSSVSGESVRCPACGGANAIVMIEEEIYFRACEDIGCPYCTERGRCEGCGEMDCLCDCDCEECAEGIDDE